MSELTANEALMSPLIGRKQKTSWGVALSLAVHAVILGVFVVLSIFEPPKLDIAQKPMNAKLVRLGQKRDQHLLPRKEIAPPPPPKTVEVPGTKPVAIKPKETTKTSSDSKPQPNRSKLFDAFAKTAAKPETPTGDEKGDPEGDSDSAEEGERYFGLVLAKARRNYSITNAIPPAELVRLKAEVVLYINSTGDLIKDPVISTSSGNAQFDQDVVLSLKKAAPFGPPPKDLVDTLKTVGVAIICTP